MFSLIASAILLLIYALIILFGPLALLCISSEIEEPMRKCYIVCILIFYPVIAGLFALALLIITLLYPCLRNTYHHGVYDPYDQGLSSISHCYLSVVSKLWSL